MKNNKPRVGLLLLAAEWFWQQNIQNTQGRYAAIPAAVDRDAARLVEILGGSVEIINPGLIHTVEQADRAARQFRESDLDLILICSLIWSEDQPLFKILQEMPTMPAVVWCYVPTETLPAQISMAELFRRSGPVGTMQHSGMLKRLGRSFGLVCGSSEDAGVIREIRHYAEAAQVARQLRKDRIGLLPYRCDVMTATYVDEFRLLKELGPAITPISIAQFADAANGLSSAEVDAFVQRLRATYEIRDVSERSLLQTARASLGLARMAEAQGLDAVAISDLVPELHRVIKVRPFLCVPEFFDQGRVMGMEGDVATTTGMLVCRRLSDSPPMYTEIFTFDPRRNAILPGHAGMHDVRLAEGPDQIRVTPDYEYYESNELEGAWLEFRGKPGRVTLASFFADVDRFKIVIVQGESLAEGPRLEGFAHLLVRLDVPLKDFFHRAIRSGMTQHWVVTHGDLREPLEKFAEILNLRCEVIA